MITHAEIIARWNAQADEHNQWDELGEDEKLEWAFACGASAVPARPTRQELEAALSAMGEKGNPVKPADIPSATDQDTHFFLAGCGGRFASAVHGFGTVTTNTNAALLLAKEAMEDVIYGEPVFGKPVRKALAAIDAALTTTAAPQAAVPETREALGKRLIADVKVANAIAAVACQRVAELPDRDSPADWPEAMLVTGDELHMIVREAAIEAQAAKEEGAA